MTCPAGNSEFCFSSTSMLPSVSPRVTLRVSGKQNSLFQLQPLYLLPLQLNFAKGCSPVNFLTSIFFLKISPLKDDELVMSEM